MAMLNYLSRLIYIDIKEYSALHNINSKDSDVYNINII